jgi:glycosyltransferase involved in cell wall biosynthesis
MHVLVTSIIDLEKTPYSRLHHFIEHLLSRGHSVTVISIRDTWKHKGQKQNQALMKRIRVHYLTDGGIGPLLQKGKAVFTLSSILKKIDLKNVDVHLSYNSLLLNNLMAGQLKKHRIQTVYDLADDLAEMVATSPQIPSYLRSFAGKVSARLLVRNLRNAGMVTFSAREFMDAMRLDRFPHIYIPNGVDLKVFRPRKSIHKGVVIGYVGALREWVDLRPMLLAVKNLTDYRIKVLIVGGEADLCVYKDFVHEHQLDKKVTFTGNVPYQEVPGYINMMDITTVPFKKNRVTDGTCPLKLLEYLACEKPAIASSLAEIQRMLGDRVLYAETVKEWEKQIATLYHDSIFRETLGTQGRKYVEEHFDWRRLCAEMERILQDHARP